MNKEYQDHKASKVNKASKALLVWGSLLRVRSRLSRICLRVLLRVICGWWLRRNRRMAGCGMPRLLRGLMVARFRVRRVFRVSKVLRGLRVLPALMGLLGLRDRRAIPGIPGLLVLKALLVRVPLTRFLLLRQRFWVV